MKKLFFVFLILFIKISGLVSQSKLLPKVIEDEVVGFNNSAKSQLKGQSLIFSKNFENVTIDTLNKVYIITFKVDEYFNKEAIAVFDSEKNTLLWERVYNFKFNDFTIFDEFALLRTRGKTIKVDIKTGRELWTIENMFLYGSDKLDIGLFYKSKSWFSKNLVEGIDLKTGKVLWTRDDLDMHGSKIIDVVNDSLVTIFEKNSIQNFNLFSGKGWQKNNIGLATYCIHGGSSTTCYNTSSALVDSTGYIITLSNKLLKLNKNGQEIWRAIFPEELQCSLPNLSVKNNSIYLLNRGGGAFSDFTRFNESYSPFFAKYDLNGNQLFFKKFDKKQLISDAIFSDDTLVTLHRKSLIKNETKEGATVFEYAIKGKEKAEISEFIGLNTFIQKADNSFVRLFPSDSMGYHIFDEAENIRKYSKNLNYISEKRLGEYWIFSGVYMESLFLKNVEKFVILNKSLNEIASFENYKRGIVKQGELFLISSNKLTKINFAEILKK